MARVILWTVAVLMAAVALVAGCGEAKPPEGPRVIMEEGPVRSYPKAEEAGGPDREQLEAEVLRLTEENDRLRQEVGEKDREILRLEAEKDALREQAEELEDRLED